MVEQNTVPHNFSYWRDQALHILPLASILSFVAVVAFLIGVFDSWGLSLTQLITPGDTIVTGLALGVITTFIIYIALLPGLIANSFLKKIEITWRPYLLVGIVAVTAPFWIPGGFGNFWIKALATVIALGCSTHLFLNIAAYRDIPFFARLATIVVMIPLAIWLVSAFTQAQDFIGEQGFAGGVTIEKTSDTPCNGRVLWLGEKTLVIQCASGKSGIRLMTSTDGLQFRPALPRKPAA